MKKQFFWRVTLLATATVLSIIFSLPSLSFYSSMPEWSKKVLPETGMTLGLDLQGGVHLVFEVEGDKAVDITIERVAARLEAALKEKGIEKYEVIKDGSNIVVTPPDQAIIDIIKENYPDLKMDDSPDRLVYSLSDREIDFIKTSSVEQALETIRNRIDEFGVAEPDLRKQGTNEIVVQLPGVKDKDKAIKLIGTPAILKFKIVDTENPLAAKLPSSIQPSGEDKLFQEFASQIPEDDEILFGKVFDDNDKVISKKVYLMKKKTLMTGDLLSDARVGIDQRFNLPVVNMTFNSSGAKLFEEITGANVNKSMAIILDDNVYSAPNINEKISGGSAMISGSFSDEEAKILANALRNGSLKAPLKLLQNVSVGPSLGRDSINAGVNAGIIGALLVICFMIVYYRMSGIIADFALMLNILFLVGMLSAFHATLTLPGIAGIILAVGLAVDSNVLMFERIREELRLGKTPRAAIDSGYDKAFWTIFDSHVTILITSIVLFQFGTGPIKGFAVTLGCGVLINLFTALVGTKTVFDIITTKWEIKKLSI